MLEPRKNPVPIVQPTPIMESCHHFKSPFFACRFIVSTPLNLLVILPGGAFFIHEEKREERLSAHLNIHFEIKHML